MNDNANTINPKSLSHATSVTNRIASRAARISRVRACYDEAQLPTWVANELSELRVVGAQLEAQAAEAAEQHLGAQAAPWAHLREVLASVGELLDATRPRTEAAHVARELAKENTNVLVLLAEALGAPGKATPLEAASNWTGWQREYATEAQLEQLYVQSKYLAELAELTEGLAMWEAHPSIASARFALANAAGAAHLASAGVELARVQATIAVMLHTPVAPPARPLFDIRRHRYAGLVSVFLLGLVLGWRGPAFYRQVREATRREARVEYEPTVWYGDSSLARLMRGEAGWWLSVDQTFYYQPAYAHARAALGVESLDAIDEVVDGFYLRGDDLAWLRPPGDIRYEEAGERMLRELYRKVLAAPATMRSPMLINDLMRQSHSTVLREVFVLHNRLVMEEVRGRAPYMAALRALATAQLAHAQSLTPGSWEGVAGFLALQIVQQQLELQLDVHVGNLVENHSAPYEALQIGARLEAARELLANGVTRPNLWAARRRAAHRWSLPTVCQLAEDELSATPCSSLLGRAFTTLRTDS